MLLLFCCLVLHKCFQSFDHNNDNTNNNQYKKRVVILHVASRCQYILLMPHEPTINNSKSKISYLRFSRFLDALKCVTFSGCPNSNHGPGHDSAVGLWLPSLLEGDDRPGGEGLRWLQPETSVVWQNGAQISTSAGPQSQGTGRLTWPLPDTHLTNLLLTNQTF